MVYKHNMNSKDATTQRSAEAVKLPLRFCEGIFSKISGATYEKELREKGEIWGSLKFLSVLETKRQEMEEVMRKKKEAEKMEKEREKELIKYKREEKEMLENIERKKREISHLQIAKAKAAEKKRKEVEKMPPSLQEMPEIRGGAKEGGISSDMRKQNVENILHAAGS